MDSKKIMGALQAPFPASEIEWRVSRSMKHGDKQKAIVLAYVTNRAIMNRLDEVFGIGNWKNEYKEWRDKGVLCGISVKIDGEWVCKWDGAEETNFEATKGGFSGSMKRTAVQWGIGRYLYNLDETWVDVTDKGEHYIDDKKSGVNGKWKNPKLPAWALPSGGQREQNKPDTADSKPASEDEKPEKEPLLSNAQLSEIEALINTLLTYGGERDLVLGQLEKSIGYNGPLETVTVDFYNNIVNKLNAWIKVKEKAAQEKELMEKYDAQYVDSGISSVPDGFEQTGTA